MMFDVRSWFKHRLNVLLTQPILWAVHNVRRDVLGAIARLSTQLGCNDTHLPRYSWPCVRNELLGERFYVEGNLIAMNLNTEQTGKVTFGPPVTRKGNPAKVEVGSVRFHVEPEDLGSVSLDPDNQYAATFVPSRALAADEGPGALIIEADADLGDGVSLISGMEALVVSEAGAFGFGAAAVEVTEQP